MYFDRAQLESNDFISDAASFQATYLGIQNDNEKLAKFSSYLEQARRDELAKPVKETKVAAAEEDIADFDAATLYV